MSAEGTRLCPHCDSEIKAAATICKYCREDVEPQSAATFPQQPAPATPQDAGKRTPAVCLLTIVAFTIVYLLKRSYCN